MKREDEPRAADGLVVEDVAFVLGSVRLMKNQRMDDTAQPFQHDLDQWKTGDAPTQRSCLETLCRETGEEFDDTLSKADASNASLNSETFSAPLSGMKRLGAYVGQLFSGNESSDGPRCVWLRPVASSGACAPG